VTAGDFVRGTEALAPVFDRFGLARFVAVNLDKLRALPQIRDGRNPDVEALLRDDARTGNWRRDESATVAVLWNGRVLHFLAVLVDAIIEHADGVLDPNAPPETASLAALARTAYAQTLQPHHNTILRAAAHALLARAPDRGSLFGDGLGYAPDEWPSRFKRDLDDLSAALHGLLAHLRGAFMELAVSDDLTARRFAL